MAKARAPKQRPLAPVMQYLPVESTAIRLIGFDGTHLEVEFRSGHTYRYAGVSAQEHAGLLDAPSVGRTLHALLKQKGLKGERVSVPPERPVFVSKGRI